MIQATRRHHRAAFVVLSAFALIGCSKGAATFGNTFGSNGSVGPSDDDGDGDATSTGGPAPTSGPATSGGPGGDPSTGLPDPGGDDDGLPPGAGDCCQGNGTPGCDDQGIASCVCAQDSFCCDNVWDDLCASMVVDMGCGDCGGDPGGTTTGGGATTADGGAVSTSSGGGNASTSGTGGGNNGSFGDCCAANNSPGCDDPGVESCVCANDSYCCDTDWDSICVDEVAQFGCGDCGGGTTTTGTTTTGGTSGGDTGAMGGDGDCCTANATHGCDDPGVESCVCDDDPYCCNSEWDSICVDEVDAFGCGMCAGGTSGTGGTTGGTGGSDGGDAGNDVGDCCAANGTAGCSIPAIEQCVCAEDGYCCSVNWDALCVDEVTTFGCATC